MKTYGGQVIINDRRLLNMLEQPTLGKLRQLRLTGMAEAFVEQLSQPLLDLDFESRLGLLVEREWQMRENRRLKRRLHEAKLQQPACMAVRFE